MIIVFRINQEVDESEIIFFSARNTSILLPLLVLLLCFKAGRHGMVMDKALRPINQKLKQLDSEFPFPIAFVYVPWMYHILIIRKCRSLRKHYPTYRNHREWIES